MATRSTHTVRCRSKENPTIFVDMVVLDAITFIRPDGVEILIAASPSIQGVAKNPCIIDNTGDGNAVGDQHNCSRISHMEQFISQVDPSQIIDLEILDGFALQPPLVGDPFGIEDRVNDEQNLGGYFDSGEFWGARRALITQSTKAKYNTIDTTGLNLGELAGVVASRGAHINLVTDKGNTDDKTDQAAEVPPVSQPFVATVKTDSINFGAPDGNNVCLLVPPSKVTDIDTTKYVTDPYTGEENAPPDNTDPNIYAFFPPDSAGANLGATPVSQQTNIAAPPSLGVFWWIKKISSTPQPWYWYAPPQQYLASSFFSPLGPAPGLPRQFGYRGYYLFNDYPVTWILEANYPLVSMGSFGSDSLTLCAEIGNWLVTGAIPNLTFTPGPEDQQIGAFGPFGVIPMTDPPIPDNLLPLNVPNIWQLTGLPQPNLAHPSLPWDALKNPYLYPSDDLAERAAQAFNSNWNTCANATNLYEQQTFVGIPEPFGSLVPKFNNYSLLPNPPPGWLWSTPYYIPGDPKYKPPGQLTGFGAFQNGIPVGMIGYDAAPAILILGVYVPINVWTMRVGGTHAIPGSPDYLDPKVWNTAPSVVPSGILPQPPTLYPPTP